MLLLKIIDGGSTGSRLHVYEFVEVVVNDENSSSNSNTSNGEHDNKHGNDGTATTTTTTIVERRGSVRTETSLSSFAASYEEDEDATDLCRRHVRQPLLAYAAAAVPARYHAATPVHFAATAGMRLLSDAQQAAVYEAVYQCLTNDDDDDDATNNSDDDSAQAAAGFGRFDVQRANIATLSGSLEGYYGAVAANYLHGTIHANLTLKAARNGSSSRTTTATAATSSTAAATTAAATSTTTTKTKITGALDMGGSSTQMVFYTATHTPTCDVERRTQTTCSSSNSNNANDNDDTDDTENGDDDTSDSNPQEERTMYCEWSDMEDHEQQQLHSDHFFSTSYLSYGVDQFRERLWNLLVHEHVAATEAAAAAAAENNSTTGSSDIDHDDADEPVCDATTNATKTSATQATAVVPNPCSNPGYAVQWQWQDDKSRLMAYTLSGTGDAELCAKYVQRLIPHPEDVMPPDATTTTTSNSNTSAKNIVGGIEHPPVGRSNSPFLAMSLYFFTLDALRVLTADAAVNAAWPTPSLAELGAALPRLCSMDWHGELQHYHGRHAFTRAEVLPHRCFEAVYMVTLLRDGFGFDSAARDITFAYTVQDSEVEWTLGMALQMRAAAVSTEQTCTWVDASLASAAGAVVDDDVDDETVDDDCMNTSGRSDNVETEMSLRTHSTEDEYDDDGKRVGTTVHEHLPLDNKRRVKDDNDNKNDNNESPECSVTTTEKKDVTFQNSNDEEPVVSGTRRNGTAAAAVSWVQLVVEVLLSDGELFSTIQ